MTGTLYLVPTPIGDPDDITMRALRVLKGADLIVCEEFREGKSLLRRYEIEKPLENLNEHNVHDAGQRIIKELIGGKSVALVSDGGTPVFSDPGLDLVQECIRRGIPVVPLPGPTSLMPALIASGFALDTFVYVGWLSPKKELRKKQLAGLKREPRTAVIMETPYRLNVLLNDMAAVLGPEREVSVAYDLTMPSEKFFRGPLGKVAADVHSKNLKGEFVVVLRGCRR